MVQFADAIAVQTKRGTTPGRTPRATPHAASARLDVAPDLAQRLAAQADTERLGDEIAELAAHLHAATYRLLALLRDFDAREGWANGFRSCAHWLSWRTGTALGVAREKVRVAHALEGLPRVSAAMERGALSFSKVRALTRVATADNEADLMEFALHGTASHVERVVRAWKRVDRQEEADAERARHESRHLSLYPDADGAWIVRGRLEPEVGALLAKALAAATEELYGKSAPSAESTVGQRRADALGRVAERSLASTPAARTADRFQVIVHLDEDQAVLSESGRRVPAGTSARLSCDAGLVEMRHDGEGHVLDVGRRRRTVPPSIRRALEHRDRTCRFPGCDNRLCDAHHVKHWREGGATKLPNMLLLCRVHHRAVHEGGFGVEIAEDGAVRFTWPNGRPMPEALPMPPLDADATATLQREHEARGLDIDAWTATPRWHGEPLELGWAVHVLRGG